MDRRVSQFGVPVCVLNETLAVAGSTWRVKNVSYTDTEGVDRFCRHRILDYGSQ